MRNGSKRFLKHSLQVFLSSFLAVAIIGLFVFVTQGRDIPVLHPAGTIADQQYQLILIVVGLGIFVVVPVFILLFSIAWRYRAANKKAKYDPELEGHKGLEILWWAIPCLIILTLAVITSISTRALDPSVAIKSNKAPITVQVIAQKWNWVFIYPYSNVATLNYMNIPEDTPVQLQITSDAPMNTFWVPALAGQVYAMSGMSAKLNLMANTTGSYNGATSNISGAGYSKLRFKVNSLTDSDYKTWTQRAATSKDMLYDDTYNTIHNYTENKPETTYKLMAPYLYDDVIMKYMQSAENTHTHEGMSH